MSTLCPVQWIRSYLLRIFDRCRNQGTKDEIFCPAMVMRWKLMDESVVHSLPELSLSRHIFRGKGNLRLQRIFRVAKQGGKQEHVRVWASGRFSFHRQFFNLTGQDEDHYHNFEPNLKWAVLLGHLYFPPLDALLQAQSNVKGSHRQIPLKL